jgi:rod shape-determining protein MreC
MRVSKRSALKQALSVLALFATLSLGQLPPQVTQFPRQVMMDVAAAPAGPLATIAGAVSAVLSFSTTTPNTAGLEKQVSELTYQLAQTQMELARTREMLASYQGFETLGPRPPAWSAAMNGYIVGGDADIFSRSYVVDVGTRDGAGKGMSVAWGNTAVGVINEAGMWHSRVRILSDPRSRVCIRFARSGREGVLAGTGRKTCYVKFVPNQVGDSEIQPGDIVVTSGADLVFPPGLIVGKVVRFAKRPAEPSAEVEVELLADYSRIQTCLVLKQAQ